DVKARYGMDAFRYYVLRDMAFGQDAEFNEDSLVARLNGDLANGLGNLASRVLAMQQRYFDGVIQPLAAEPIDLALRSAFATPAALSAHRGPGGVSEPLSLVDSHCHLAEPDFDADRDAVLQRAVAAGVTGLVCVGATGAVESNFPAVALAGRPAPVSIVATVGIHPHDAS